MIRAWLVAALDRLGERLSHRDLRTEGRRALPIWYAATATAVLAGCLAPAARRGQ